MGNDRVINVLLHSHTVVRASQPSVSKWILMSVVTKASEFEAVKKTRPKFFCVNDDLAYGNPKALTVLDYYRQFMNAYFPSRSSFELPGK